MLSALLRAGRFLIAGLSRLSTADSILMSYQKYRETKPWIFCGRDQCVVKGTAAYSHYGIEPGNPGGSGSLWLCGTRGRPYQSFWELRVLVGTSLINLILSEIFYCCKVSALELGPGKISALELGPAKVGILELRLGKV